jgi:hypothetical protein
MFLTFSTTKGSVEILNVFWRWGWRPECLEPAMDRAYGDSGFSGEGTAPPLGAAVAGLLLRRRLRLGLQRSVDHFGYLVCPHRCGDGRDVARHAGPQCRTPGSAFAISLRSSP